MRRPSWCGVGLVAVLLTGCSGPRGQVVLVTIDTLRADHVGAIRNGVPLTPELDRLARRAITFRDAWAAATMTLPSHATFLTGLEPFRHRVLSNDHVLPEDVPTLSEALAARGFATGAVVSSFPLVAERSGLDRGFGSYEQTFDSHELNRARQVVKSPEATTRAALAWARAHARESFFLWVHYFPPHGPYAPPPEFRAGLAEASASGSLAVSERNFERGRIPAYQRLGEERDPAAYRSRYAAHVRYVDRSVGALLDGLDALGVSDAALVIVTSDHGESLGERDWYFCHGNLVSREQVSIPLLVKLPGDRRAGTVVHAPVAGVDVAPTVLDVLGLQGVMATQGRSLLGSADGPRLRFSQSSDAEVVAVADARRKLALRLGAGLLPEDHPARELYRIDADPLELQDLVAAETEAAARLEAEARRRFTGVSGTKSALDAETEERLRALGYVQ